MVQMRHSVENPAAFGDIEGPKWFAVQTRSRFEKVVRAELDHSGIEQYLPMIEETHQWKDRKKTVELPLFPGYIFARCTGADNDRLRVLKINGVVRILGTSGSGTSGSGSVPDSEIDTIHKLLLSGKKYFPHPFLRKGAWVRVRRGALAGIEGRLVRLKNQARLVLSVELLAQSVATEVEARDVEPAPEPRPVVLNSTGRIS